MGTRKLSPEQVLQIRQAAKDGGTIYRVSKEMGLCYSTVRSVIRCINWKRGPFPEARP